ncbi:unnamed protein product, partial [marine sediment metagenome]
KKESNKITAIHKKLDYLDEACKKNLNLSSAIRAKLLSSDPKEAEEAEKTPKEGGQLNNIRDQLQDLLNLVNCANAHLVSVNKEI